MLKPIIKWAGGKARILELFTLLYTMSNSVRYIDLFCGSLSLPLILTPKNAIFNDINSALINMYKIVKHHKYGLMRELDRLDSAKYNNCNEFNLIRREFNNYKQKYTLKLVERIKYAAMFIYLNRRSYNGLYRENRLGVYNVPYRRYNTHIYNKEEVEKMSRYLKHVTLCNKDFSCFNPSFFKCGDLVYIDPPYYPSRQSQFTSYWKKPFLKEEQLALLKFCQQLDKQGVKFIVSNSPCPQVRKMYKEFFQFSFYIGRQMRDTTRKKSDKHMKENEILIWNFCNIKFIND